MVRVPGKKMLSDSLKRWLGGHQPPPGKESPPGEDSGPGVLRHSNGLGEFFLQLSQRRRLKVLDLGAASQANINFITGLGQTINHEDLYPELAAYAYRVRLPEGGTGWDAGAFLEHNLKYPPALFDAVLCWEALDLLPDPAAAPQVVARLAQITKPGAPLLMFFHTAEPGKAVPVCHSQICGLDSLRMFPRAQFRMKRPLNNRNIENLFRKFHALKFFLSRDHLREVLAVR